MTWFEQLKIHLRDLYLNNLSYVVDAFKPAFRTFFGEEHQTFRLKMFHNLDHLGNFFASKGVNSSDHLNQCLQQDFKEYTLCEPDTYRRDYLENLDTFEAVIHRVVITYGILRMKENEVNALKVNGKQLNKEILHEIKKSFKLQSQDVQINPVQAVDDSLIISKSSWIESENNIALNKSVNETQLQQHESLVTEESSRTKSDKHDTSSSSGNYITHDVDADFRPVNDQVPFAGKTVENADLKAQIQEKVFVNAALKNELRKLKGNSVDTKFSKALILGKPPLQPSRNHSFVRQPNVFKSKRPRILKPQFASQVDEKNILSKPVSPHYFPNIRESAPTKSHHVNAPSSARNSQKDSYGSNDMAHNYFLEEAMKKTQDRNRNLKPREMPSARTHHTPNACTPRPRSNNKTFRNWSASKSSNVKLNIVQKAYHSRNSSSFLDSKHFVCSTCQKCVFNENHDACVTKLLNEVNSRARKPSHKSTTRYKPIEKISNTKKSLRWKPEGRVFKTVGLKWIPTGKIFTSSTTKVGSEPPNGLNEDITNLYECEETHTVSADNTSTPAPQRKEKCTIQCSLSSKEEKSLCILSSSEGSGIIPEVPDEPKDNSEVAEKQAGNVQTSLTMSIAKLEIQSMVDVPIHQEDPTIQRTLLINTIISMITDKTTSTPTLPTTQAQVQMCSTSCWKDSSRESRKLHPSDTHVFTIKMKILLEPTSNKLLLEPEDYIKMEMQIPRSNRVKFIATCSYSRLNDFITSRKNDPKLLQTLISTSSEGGPWRGQDQENEDADLGEYDIATEGGTRLTTFSKLARLKPEKYPEEADVSKDISGPESLAPIRRRNLRRSQAEPDNHEE
ncbi:hypothetical protein Tco_1191149 [Tanacetum coccineum]